MRAASLPPSRARREMESLARGLTGVVVLGAVHHGHLSHGPRRGRHTKPLGVPSVPPLPEAKPPGPPQTPPWTPIAARPLREKPAKPSLTPAGTRWRGAEPAHGQQKERRRCHRAYLRQAVPGPSSVRRGAGCAGGSGPGFGGGCCCALSSRRRWRESSSACGSGAGLSRRLGWVPRGLLLPLKGGGELGVEPGAVLLAGGLAGCAQDELGNGAALAPQGQRRLLAWAAERGRAPGVGGWQPLQRDVPGVRLRSVCVFEQACCGECKLLAAPTVYLQL